jgi:hypothetical protein
VSAAELKKYIAYEKKVASLLSGVPPCPYFQRQWDALGPAARAATGAVYVGIDWKEVTDRVSRFEDIEYRKIREDVIFNLFRKIDRTGYRHFTIFMKSHVGQLELALKATGKERISFPDFTDVTIFASRGVTMRPQFPVPLVHTHDHSKSFFVKDLAVKREDKKREVFFAGSCSHKLRCYVPALIHQRIFANCQNSHEAYKVCAHLKYNCVACGNSGDEKREAISCGTCVDDNNGKLAYNVRRCGLNLKFPDYVDTLQRSTWFLSLPGVMPAAFGWYEALLASNLPIFVYSTSRAQTDQVAESLIASKWRQCHDPSEKLLTGIGASALDSQHFWAPYRDIGVRWTDIGEVTTLEGLPAVLDKIGRMPEDAITKRLALGNWLRPLFAPEGVFEYMLWVMRNYKDRSNAELLAAQCAAMKMATTPEDPPRQSSTERAPREEEEYQEWQTRLTAHGPDRD